MIYKKSMVLEAIFNPFQVKRYPWQMFIAGALYSFIAFILSFIVFKEIAGILMVFLVVLACLPIVYTTIKNEEELDMSSESEIALLKEHTKVLVYLIFLFFGIVFTFVIIYVFFPQNIVDSTFTLQQQAIQTVNNDVQARSTGTILLFNKIFFNNLKVLFFCLVFSLLYGTGALFILTWNASVIAAAMGNIRRTEIANSATAVGFTAIAGYFTTATFSFFRYMTHGILEIGAYFIAGLAGGIISIALVKHNLKENKVIIDALDLVLISVGLLVVAGLVEVYITPVLFS